MVGVTLFSSVAPDNFAVFDRAFLTLFYVTGGDPWPDALPKFNEDGTANWVVAAFIMGYTMIEIWVILQVGPAAPTCSSRPLRSSHTAPAPPCLCVCAAASSPARQTSTATRRTCDAARRGGGEGDADSRALSDFTPTPPSFAPHPVVRAESQVSVAVLLDNFITASTQMEQHEKEQETARILRDNQSRNPLEPLLVKVCDEPSLMARGRGRRQWRRKNSNLEDQVGEGESDRLCARTNREDGYCPNYYTLAQLSRRRIPRRNALVAE